LLVTVRTLNRYTYRWFINTYRSSACDGFRVSRENNFGRYRLGVVSDRYRFPTPISYYRSVDVFRLSSSVQVILLIFR
jgi:hypothetical protein